MVTRWASAIQIVRPSESTAETLPQLSFNGFAEIVSSDGCRRSVNESYLGTPVPARGTACVPPPPSSWIWRDAARGPVALGLNRTWIAQFAFAGRLEPQVVVSAKSPKLVPAMPMAWMLKGVLPVLVSVTVCARLVVPTL